jgi:hypothetical protein
MSDHQNINKTYLFIDESGDPSFYASGNRCIVGTEGFKPLLLIGIVKLEDKKIIRQAILQFMDEIKGDPLYNALPCVTDPKGWYLHASYDNLEIRVKFVEFLRKLEGFKFYCVIGRKRLDVFHKKHNRNETEFYFDLVTHLIKGRLDKEETFYLEAIENALKSDNTKRESPLKIKYNCEIVLSQETPELSIVDYLLWAIQRYILQGDKRFYKALEAKYNLIIDLYDADGEKSKYYEPHNRFDIDKAGEFRKDGYV